MTKKAAVKRTAGKAAKTGKPAKAAKTRPVEPKAHAKTQAKPVQSRAKTETTLKLNAPEAEQVCIVGCFNEWDPTANFLEQDGDGIWSCTLVLEPGEYEYRYVVDGDWWDDPMNVLRRPNGFGTENCVLIV